MRTILVVVALFVAQLASAQTTLPLVQPSNLVYQGAFRLPADVPTQSPTCNGYMSVLTYAYGTTALGYWPAHNSLVAVGHPWCQYVGEFSIPALVNSSTVDGLARAPSIQPLTDILAGHLTDVGAPGDSVVIGGLLPTATNVLVSAYEYYDASSAQWRSHFLAGQSFAAPTESGPYQIGNTEAGFVSGYMGTIPSAWQALLGGTHLTGNCCIPIIARSSFGPSVSVFNAADVGVVSPVPGMRVLAYPADHETLGGCGGVLFNCAVQMGGVVFPEGSRSVLFFGRLGSNYCYGVGTADPSLAGMPVPGTSDIYCYDPTDSSKGTHTYPNTNHVWAYDANDLAAVKAGTKQPWDVVPYADWAFDLPFQNDARLITAATFDPATSRIFLAAKYTDGSAPLIYVLAVSGLTPPPPPPPDPCVTNPLAPTVSRWPSSPSQSASGTWNPNGKTLVSAQFVWTPSLRFLATDTRGCTATKVH